MDSTRASLRYRVEYTEEDQKPIIEQECKVHCVKQWKEYKVGDEGTKGGMPASMIL